MLLCTHCDDCAPLALPEHHHRNVDQLEKEKGGKLEAGKLTECEISHPCGEDSRLAKQSVSCWFSDFSWHLRFLSSTFLRLCADQYKGHSEMLLYKLLVTFSWIYVWWNVHDIIWITLFSCIFQFCNFCIMFSKSFMRLSVLMHDTVLRHLSCS